MVLNYYATNYIGWSLPALLLCYKGTKKYVNYATFSARNFIKSC